MEQNTLEERKQRLISFLKKDWSRVYYIIAAFLIYWGYKLRTSNIPLLQDKYPPDLDSYLFLRYSRDLIENGYLPAIDFMRNYPLGFNLAKETLAVPYFVSYLHQILSIFNPAITATKATILYPPVAFAIGMAFFFLFVKQLLNIRIAVIATAFLTFIPSYLYRTVAGVSDKEALGMMLMFIVLYFFTISMQAKTAKRSILYGALGGAANAVLGMAWGGVSFMFMVIGIYGFAMSLFNNFTKNEMYAYLSYTLSMTSLIMMSPRFIFNSLITSFTSVLIYVSALMIIINLALFKLNIFNIKTKLKDKLPTGVSVLIIALILGFIAISITNGPGFFLDKPASVIYDLLNPLKDRWALTVAESHEPYITDWIGNFTWKFMWFFIIGSIILFYETIKQLKKYKWYLTLAYGIFILSFIFSRYSRESATLNGVSSLAKFMYIGSAIMFMLFIFIFYLYLFYKDRESFNSLTPLSKNYIFALILFIIFVMGARRAIRLVFVFSPVVSIIGGYFIMQLIDYAKLLKNDIYKSIAFLFVAFLLLNPFTLGSADTAFGLFDKGTLIQFTGTTTAQAKVFGPSFNQQWQVAMEWVKANTPKDAVFAHWWDYGYWVQTGGERATITDGGNAIGYWNYLMGRNVLTGQNDMDALEFLYAHNASYLLMISDEIGKYPAFSSIGSDANYDRYAWINVFSLEENNIRETRNSTIYAYRGGFTLTDDVIYNGKIYPRQAAGIAAVMVPLNIDSEKVKVEQPQALVIYNNQQQTIPVKCLFLDGNEIVFDGEGINGCFMIIPAISGNNVNKVGSAMFLGERVWKSRFAQLYLFGKQNENFATVYNDEKSLPLSVYNGRLIGPLKIWKISYPEGMESKEIYEQTSFPDDSVTKI